MAGIEPGANHNNFAYSNKESREENPKGEAALTFDFLKNKGYELEDDWKNISEKLKERSLKTFEIRN